MKLRLVIGHPQIIYKQALRYALELFGETIVVGEARYYEELLMQLKKNGPDFVIADKSIFGSSNRLQKTARSNPRTNFIVLTDKEEEILSNALPNVQFFLTLGYLIDLYRLIILTAENKKFAQPAVIKILLSNIKKLEEIGISTDTLFLEFDRKQISILIDVILGKSFDDILYKTGLTPEELNREIDLIIKTIHKIVNAFNHAEGKQ